MRQSGSSMIFFTLVSRGKGRKLHPATVLKLKVFSLNVSCSDSDGNRAQPHAVSYSPYGVNIPVNNRAFAVTYTLQQAPYVHNGWQTFETEGRIPRKGDHPLHRELGGVRPRSSHLRFHDVVDGHHRSERNYPE
jgi:hypothetical protein